MTHSTKRARRKRLAQEEKRREESPHQMDPLNLSEPEMDKEEDDHEILFPARARESEERLVSPMRAKETIDCDIVNMVKILNGAFVSLDTAQIQRTYQQLCSRKHDKRQGPSRPNCYGQRIQLITGGHETIWPVTGNHATSSDNTGGLDGRRGKSACR